ncbi:MAG: protein phosphatase 2C domain-containing protein [Acidobacteriales bacterium]|nr:protein phosphatase 2C domain-containing protein [Terriglobales bacterium]
MPMLEAFGQSDCGCVRQNNEDSFLIAPDLGLYVVADGMGGAAGGEVASRLAIEAIEQVVRANTERSTAVLISALENANLRVSEIAKAEPSLQGMGTTVVAGLETAGELLLASVGDSRAYAIRDGELAQVTTDQTWVEEVGRRLGLTEEQLRNHPMRHMLTMVVGIGEALRVQTTSLPLTPGLRVLLSTDGLHGVVNTPKLAEVIKKPISLSSQAHYLIEAAREAGGPDNITVVLLRVTE